MMSETEANAEKISYSGSCHCGEVKFRFLSPVIETGLQCNCSICVRKNAIMSREYIAPEDFEFLSGKNSLSLYHWGDRDVNHWFCKHCGIYPFHDSIYEPGKFKINLGCVDGLDPHSLEIRLFDGKNLL